MKGASGIEHGQQQFHTASNTFQWRQLTHSAFPDPWGSFLTQKAFQLWSRVALWVFWDLLPCRLWNGGWPRSSISSNTRTGSPVSGQDLGHGVAACGMPGSAIALLGTVPDQGEVSGSGLGPTHGSHTPWKPNKSWEFVHVKQKDLCVLWLSEARHPWWNLVHRLERLFLTCLNKPGAVFLPSSSEMLPF